MAGKNCKTSPAFDKATIPIRHAFIFKIKTMGHDISKSVVAIALAFFIVSGCKKSESPATYMNNAIITGYDLRLCACCGGLLINFNNDTINYNGTFLRL